MAQTHGLGRERVEAMIELVGPGGVAGKRAGTFSLGCASASASPRRCSPTRAW
jgi:hypothetical protein